MTMLSSRCPPTLVNVIKQEYFEILGLLPVRVAFLLLHRILAE